MARAFPKTRVYNLNPLWEGGCETQVRILSWAQKKIAMEIGNIITSVLTDMPVGFKVRQDQFFLFPQTLGKIYLTSQLVESLCVDREFLKVEPFIEAMRIAKEKKEEACRLIAYHTLKTKDEILSQEILSRRAEYFSTNLDTEDIATLLISILKDNTLNEIIKESGLDKEAQRMQKVNAAKKTSHTYIFGGKTVWGSLIDAACERYGWTYDYVVWRISYANLTLMLKDKITSIYLSEEEAKHCRVPQKGEEIIDGNNREAVMKAALESEAHV